MKFAGVSYTPTSFLNLFTSSVFSTEVDKGTTLALSVLLLLSCTYVWTFLSRAFARADLLGFCTTLPLNNEVGAGGNSYAKYPQISLVCCIRAINLGNKTIGSITTWSFLNWINYDMIISNCNRRFQCGKSDSFFWPLNWSFTKWYIVKVFLNAQTNSLSSLTIHTVIRNQTSVQRLQERPVFIKRVMTLIIKPFQ